MFFVRVGDPGEADFLGIQAFVPAVLEVAGPTGGKDAADGRFHGFQGKFRGLGDHVLSLFCPCFIAVPRAQQSSGRMLFRVVHLGATHGHRLDERASDAIIAATLPLPSA